MGRCRGGQVPDGATECAAIGLWRRRALDTELEQETPSHLLYHGGQGPLSHVVGDVTGTVAARPKALEQVSGLGPPGDWPTALVSAAADSTSPTSSAPANLQPWHSVLGASISGPRPTRARSLDGAADEQALRRPGGPWANHVGVRIARHAQDRLAWPCRAPPCQSCPRSVDRRHRRRLGWKHGRDARRVHRRFTLLGSDGGIVSTWRRGPPEIPCWRKALEDAADDAFRCQAKPRQPLARRTHYARCQACSRTQIDGLLHQTSGTSRRKDQATFVILRPWTGDGTSCTQTKYLQLRNRMFL